MEPAGVCPRAFLRASPAARNLPTPPRCIRICIPAPCAAFRLCGPAPGFVPAQRPAPAPASALLHACAHGLSSRLRRCTTLISARAGLGAPRFSTRARALRLRLLLRSRPCPPHGICPRRRAVYASVSPRPAPRSVYAAARPRLCPRATAPRRPPGPACFSAPVSAPAPRRPTVLPDFLHPAPAPVLPTRASLRLACPRPNRPAPVMQFPPRPAPEYEKRRTARTNCRKY